MTDGVDGLIDYVRQRVAQDEVDAARVRLDFLHADAVGQLNAMIKLFERMRYRLGASPADNGFLDNKYEDVLGELDDIKGGYLVSLTQHLAGASRNKRIVTKTKP